MKTKFLKTTCIVLMGITALCGFSSCSNDDDEIGGGTAKPTWVLASMDSDKFNYDSEGRVVSVDGRKNWCSSLSYGKDKITGYGVTFHLNNGLVTGWVNDEGDTYSYRYNKEKQLTSLGWDGETSFSFLWKNGLITEYEYGRESSDNEMKYLDGSNMNAECVRTLNAFIIAEEIEDEYPWILAMRGYLGPLPTKPITSVQPSYSPYGAPTKISYGSLDTNGCPSTVTVGDDEYQLVWKKL